MDTAATVTIPIVILIITFVIFLAIRQVILWYFRLNQIANDIAYIADHYRRIDQARSAPIAGAVAQQPSEEARPDSRSLPKGIRPRITLNSP